MFDQNNYYSSSSSTFTYINIFITFVNFIFAVLLNTYFFKSRRDNDRKYQSNINLYNSLVISKIENTVEFSSDVSSIARKLIELNLYPATCRSKVEECCDDIETALGQCINKLVPYINCYSNDMGNKFKNNCEVFSDRCTDCVTKLTGEHNKKVLFDDLTKYAASFLEETFTLIKYFKPQP